MGPQPPQPHIRPFLPPRLSAVAHRVRAPRSACLVGQVSRVLNRNMRSCASHLAFCPQGPNKPDGAQDRKHIIDFSPIVRRFGLIRNVLFCRGQGLPRSPWRRYSVHRACRTGLWPLTAKLIAGHGAGGGRQGPRPVCPGAAGVLGLYPGQAQARARAPGRPGTSALDHPAVPNPSQVARPRKYDGRAAVQLIVTWEDELPGASALCPGVTLSDTRGHGERAHSRRSARLGLRMQASR
jgi:hypothetical protein